MRKVPALILLLLVILIVFGGCSGQSEGSDSDGDQPDGDSIADGDAEFEDVEDSDSEISPDGDEDGDVEPESIDGNSEIEAEAEEVQNPYRLNCEEPWEIPVGPWYPDLTHQDSAFIQRHGILVEEGLPAGAIPALIPATGGGVIAATSAGLFNISESGLPSRLENWSEDDFVALAANGTDLIAATGAKLHVGAADSIPAQIDVPNTVSKLRPEIDDEVLVLTTDMSIGRFDADTKTFSEWMGPFSDLQINDFVSAADDSHTQMILLATEEGIKRVLPDTRGLEDVIFLSAPPSSSIRNITFTPAATRAGEATLKASTDQGMFTCQLQAGQDLEDASCEVDQDLPFLDLGPFAGEYIGSSMGVIAPKDKGGYFHSRYYIPNNVVLDLLPDPTGKRLYVATEAGVGIIVEEEISLAAKAASLDDGMYSRHNRFGMFCRNALRVRGELSSFYTFDDDNDGQWTNMYLASQVFRYVVTQSDTAKAIAKEAAVAMLRLLEVDGKDGFFARSVVPPDECEAKQCEGCGEWHLSDDEQWCWKGDTSSDEYVGHVYGLSLFYDFVADESEKQLVREAFVKLHDGIIDNGYILEDIDGQITSHGNFDPEFMELLGIFGDAGLNGAMILGGLRATYHMSGEQRFMDAFNYLAFDRGYMDYVRRIEQINLMVHHNHDSEEMSFLALSTLIRYETDPCLMALWQEGLDYLWQMNRSKRSPEFNMLYASMSLKDSDLANSIATLQQYHSHGISWNVFNSHRRDYTLDDELDRFDRAQSLEVFPYNQKQFLRWSTNPFRLDWDSGMHDGYSEEMLTPWLLPYWMGRFMGLIVD